LYVADSGNGTIRKIAPDGTVTTLAGSAGQTGSSDGTGIGASFRFPASIAWGSSGNLYVADTFNDTIRAVTLAGVVTPVAGDPTPTDPNRPFISYTDGTGSAAHFHYPQGVALDSAGNVYVADSGNHAIRKVTPQGSVSTLVGGSQTGADDGPG